jgi:hypothetical protein
MIDSGDHGIRLLEIDELGPAFGRVCRLPSRGETRWRELAEQNAKAGLPWRAARFRELANWVQLKTEWCIAPEA